MRRAFLVVLISGIFLTALIQSGCNNPLGVSSETLSKLREAFLMEEEPDGIIQVTEARDILLGANDEEPLSQDEAESLDESEAPAESDDSVEVAEISFPTEAKQVVLIGHVGGLTNPWEKTQPDYPFSKNKAKFFLADAGEVAENEATGHVHAPGEECAFCAAHAKENFEKIAVVQFLDENGKIAPVEISTLFDVKERDTVVIQGEARIIEGGILVVNATGLYVRR